MSISEKVATRVGRRTLHAATALVAGPALVLSACGTVSKLTTERAVSQSVSGLASQSSLTLRLSLGVSEDQVHQIAAKTGDRTVTPAQAHALSVGSIFVTEVTGHGEGINSKQASTDQDNSYELGLRIGNDVPADLRFVSRALYLRVDVNQLLTDVGEDPAQAAKFGAGLASADKYVPGLSALGQGRWVEVTPQTLQSLAAMLKQYAGSLGTAPGSGSSGGIASTFTSLRKDLVNALSHNSQFQNHGTQSGITRYGVTVDVRGLLNQLTPALQKDLSALPGGFGSQAASALDKAKAKVADRQVVFDILVRNHKAEEIDLDLNQFAGNKKMDFPVPLKLNLGTAPAVAAPSGATPLDLSKLPGLIMGMLGGSGSRGSSVSGN